METISNCAGTKSPFAEKVFSFCDKTGKGDPWAIGMSLFLVSVDG